MGAPLDQGRVCDGALVCPWHGLSLGAGGHGAWRPLETHDDGVVLWLRFDSPAVRPEHDHFSARGLREDEASALTRPPRLLRPTHFVAGVVRTELACDPEDVMARRLDPWASPRGRFEQLLAKELLVESDERLVVRAESRCFGPRRRTLDLAIECPSARSVTMTVLSGEAEGSVIETHATPSEAGRTSIVEATLVPCSDPSAARQARSQRLLGALHASLGRGLRSWLEFQTRRRWRHDARYVERLCQLRQGGTVPDPARQSEHV